MTTYFSDHYSATGSMDSSVDAPPVILSAGLKHGRMRICRASITLTDTAAADDFRMFTLKSSARLFALYLGSNGGFSASNSAEVGLYLAGSNHDGAVVDVDLFGAAHDLTGSIDNIDSIPDVAAQPGEIFCSGALDSEDRMKTLWELAAVGAATYTEDPRVDFDFVIDGLGDDDATSSIATLIAVYTAGD